MSEAFFFPVCLLQISLGAYSFNYVCPLWETDKLDFHPWEVMTQAKPSHSVWVMEGVGGLHLSVWWSMRFWGSLLQTQNNSNSSSSGNNNNNNKQPKQKGKAVQREDEWKQVYLTSTAPALRHDGSLFLTLILWAGILIRSDWFPHMNYSPCPRMWSALVLVPLAQLDTRADTYP